MDVTTLTISLPKNVGTALANKAKLNGRDSVEFVEDLIFREVNSPSLDEVLAPFRRQVDEIGMSEDDLDDLFTKARKKVFKAKKELQKA